MTNNYSSLSNIENKDHIEQAIKHIGIVMSHYLSNQTTTWNYLNAAIIDLKTVLEVVYK